MSAFLDKVRLIATDEGLRKKLFFVFLMLVIFRFGANIPIPAVDPARLATFLEQNQFLGLLNVFSGGGLSNLSVFMLGVSPYITATIIMQLLTMIFPRLKEMYHEEGSAGRQRFMMYSRFITVPLAIIQAVGLLALLRSQGVIGQLTGFDYIFNIIIAVAGSMLLMWLGELMSEYGIGNGVSLIIFAGIVASLPATLAQLAVTFTVAQVPLLIGFLIVGVLIIAGIIIITEAERPIPITYAKQVRGMKMYGGQSTYLPLRVNQAGVIPIIFALSILLFPQIIINFFGAVDNALVQSVVSFLTMIVNNLWFYGTLYFILVFIFTYFYTAVTFDPDAIATNLQKNGAFIPGIRPGQPTSQYIAKILTRITLVGATFLGAIAVLPFVMQALTNNPSLAIGGTSLLIVVSVVLDLVKKIDGQVSLREY
jgi:preprotein translocase subunit SecY